MSVPMNEPPLDWPYYGIGFVPAVKRAFQKYATFTGRASRGEYWWWILGYSIIFVVLYALTLGLGLANAAQTGKFGAAGIPFAILTVIFVLATIIPNISITIRRLHDAGYSGWFLLFNIVGLGIITTILCILPTSPNAAQYGPPAPQGYGPGYPPQPPAGYGDQPPANYGQQPPTS